jgi:ABC-type transport system substrate-binding protein
MEAIKIPVKREPVTFDTMFYRMYTGDFDIVEVPWGWSPWANSLWMLCSDRGPLSWLTNWHNATFEAYVDIVMTSVNETEVQEATADALRLMTEELPFVSFYEPIICFAFDPGLRGIIEDLYLPWSLLRMQWATPGGTVKLAIGTQPQTLNPLTSVSNLDAWLSRIFDGLSEGLLSADPWTGLPSIEYACTSFNQELTANGGMKMTIVLKPGMYWHDGVEVTAEDVAFCFEYTFRTGCPGSGGAVENFINATVIDKYTVVLYYSKSSFWTKYMVSYYALIAPKHIWNNDTSIYGEPAGLPGIQAGYAYGVGDPINFRPELVPYPGRETELTCLIGSGAYIFRPDSWHGDEYIKLYANRNYHRRPLLTDTNFDFKVDIIDIASAAKAFGTKLGDKRWKGICDINGDNIVDIIDIALIAKDFNKSW